MKLSPSQTRSGFSLVEVALALGIAAFCILPLIGLLGVGYDANQASVRQTSAATIAAAISADLKATSPLATTTPYFGLSIPSAGTSVTKNLYVREDGVWQTTFATDQQTFLATVVITSAASGTLKAGSARILITWPATPNQITGAVPTKYSGSLETLVGLNAN